MTGGIILLTGDKPQHCRVARALAQTGELGAIIIDRGVPRSRGERLRTARRRFGTVGLAARLASRTLHHVSGANAREFAAMTSILGKAVMPAGVVSYDTRGVNTDATRDLLRRLAPRVLCVYGTSIVKEPTLSFATEIALNMHTGISPRYRGADCAFWPLYHGEPQWLGATVHECTAAIDGGAIYGTTRALVEADDGVAEIFARCVVAGAELYQNVLLQILDGSAAARTQDLSTGREYRASMRSWRAELRVRRALAAGLIRDYVAAGQPVDWPGDGDA